MKLLDTDKDELIGFYDFLVPILHVLPAEILAAFTADQRFKQETFNDLRIAYNACKTKAEGGYFAANIDLLRSKFVEKGAA